MPAGRSTTLEINRDVRRILVSRWIDLGRVAISAASTTVYLRGSLHKLSGSEGQINSTILEQMYQKIRRIKGISNIILQLENWERTSNGAWEPKGDDANSGRKARSHEAPEQGVYRIQGEG